jgi:hypothetical protein
MPNRTNGQAVFTHVGSRALRSLLPAIAFAALPAASADAGAWTIRATADERTVPVRTSAAPCGDEWRSDGTDPCANRLGRLRPGSRDTLFVRREEAVLLRFPRGVDMGAQWRTRGGRRIEQYLRLYPRDPSGRAWTIEVPQNLSKTAARLVVYAARAGTKRARFWSIPVRVRPIRRPARRSRLLDPVPQSGAWLAADGDRWVGSYDGVETHFADDQSGERYLSHLVGACGVLGSGFAASGCGYGSADIVDIARNEIVARPTWQPRSESEEVDAVGREWLRLRVSGYHYSGRGYVNWRTGRLATGFPSRARAAADLDEPGLWRPLCSPLRRRRDRSDPYDNHPFHRDYQYLPPYGLTQRDGGDRAAGIRDGGALLLERCGQKRPTVLSRCWRWCADPKLGPRHVVWVEDGRLVMRRLADGATVRLETGERAEDLENARLSLTRARAYVSVPRSRYSPNDYNSRGYSAALP